MRKERQQIPGSQGFPVCLAGTPCTYWIGVPLANFWILVNPLSAVGGTKRRTTICPVPDKPISSHIKSNPICEVLPPRATHLKCGPKR